jgi:hypothetical protein
MESVAHVLLVILGGVCTGVLILPILALVIWSSRREARRYLERSQALLPEWANKEGYTIIYQERLPFWSTPFFPWGHQIHYRVVAEDGRGQRRRGWVVFGSWPRGIYSGRVKVVWEVQEPTHQPSSVAVQDPRTDPLWDDWLDH